MSKHLLINSNSNKMLTVKDTSVNLIITSPPYPMIKMWNDLFCSFNDSINDDLEHGKGNNAFEKMHKILDDVWNECDRVLKDGGFICINIGDAIRTLSNNFQLYPNKCRIMNYFSNKGYNSLPGILWKKQSNTPTKFMGSGMLAAGAYITQEHEHILIFRKNGKRIFDENEKTFRRKSAYFWEERNMWFSDLWDLKGTNQQIKNNNKTRERNASFPFEIPYRLVNMFSIYGDTVLDPFTGLGTTNIACLASNRNSIGFDIDSEIIKIAQDRIIISKNTINSHIQNRIDKHIDFIESLPKNKITKLYTNQHHDFLVKTKQEIEIDIRYLDTVKYSNEEIIGTYK